MNEVDEDSIHGDRVLAEDLPGATGAIAYNQCLRSFGSSLPGSPAQIFNHGARL
jgi:hypothetical protein